MMTDTPDDDDAERLLAELVDEAQLDLFDLANQRGSQIDDIAARLADDGGELTKADVMRLYGDLSLAITRLEARLDRMFRLMVAVERACEEEERDAVSVKSGRYRYLRMPDHPLATRGIVPEHRAVLYAAIGPGDHPCHWCGRLVKWGMPGQKQGDTLKLVVDHLDDNGVNNDRSNLVPSCYACNTSRGWSWSEVAANKRREMSRMLVELFSDRMSDL